MKIFYRISDATPKKDKYVHATKKVCLENFLKHFPKEEVTIYADSVRDDTFEWLQMYDCNLKRTVGGSNAGGFRITFNDALQLADNEVIYFVEDDYLHLENSRNILLEGVERAHYVTLYDCIDKYMLPEHGGNQFIGQDGAEETKVFLTNSRHWKLTNSTTMTFATMVGTLREDANIWRKHTSGTHPWDFQCFIELGSVGRTVASPIPTLSTHCEPRWAAPLVDWNEVY